MVKIPSKFLQQDSNVETSVKEVYINVNKITVFEINKYIQEILEKDGTKEFETVYFIRLILENNYYVPIKHDMDEKLFQEFILWCNKQLAFANIIEKD